MGAASGLVGRANPLPTEVPGQVKDTAACHQSWVATSVGPEGAHVSLDTHTRPGQRASPTGNHIGLARSSGQQNGKVQPWPVRRGEGGGGCSEWFQSLAIALRPCLLRGPPSLPGLRNPVLGTSAHTMLGALDLRLQAALTQLFLTRAWTEGSSERARRRT